MIGYIIAMFMQSRVGVDEISYCWRVSCSTELKKQQQQQQQLDDHSVMPSSLKVTALTSPDLRLMCSRFEHVPMLNKRSVFANDSEGAIN